MNLEILLTLACLVWNSRSNLTAWYVGFEVNSLTANF